MFIDTCHYFKWVERYFLQTGLEEIFVLEDTATCICRLWVFFFFFLKKKKKIKIGYNMVLHLCVTVSIKTHGYGGSDLITKHSDAKDLFEIALEGLKSIYST
jgi:hypothetical protein